MNFKSKLQMREDLTTPERELMMNWNTYLRRYPVYADAHVPSACLGFVSAYAPHLCASMPLRRCFMVHMVHLWEYNLVSPDVVDQCMQVIDNARPAKHEAQT